jgi:hypothetical protein
MAHFAKIENNIVTQVIVIDNQFEQQGQSWINNTLGLEGEWMQTSYNDNFRGNFAGNGYTYDRENDVFISPQPYPSWVLDENWKWQPPTSIPDTTRPGWVWHEEALQWFNILE